MKRKPILLISVLFLVLNLVGAKIIEVPEAVGGVAFLAGGTPVASSGESLLADVTGGGAFATITAQSSGTTYARTAFRMIDAITSSDWSPTVGLYNSGTLVASSGLRGNGADLYRIYTHDSTTDVNSTFTGKQFNDQTYWLYLTYNRGTSVVAEVKDSTQTLVSSRTLTTTDSLSCNQVRLFYTTAAVVFDMVEVRSDTNWGNVTNQIFYSDFNDGADDSQWDALPTGWDDDYTTTVLE